MEKRKTEMMTAETKSSDGGTERFNPLREPAELAALHNRLMEAAARLASSDASRIDPLRFSYDPKGRPTGASLRRFASPFPEAVRERLLHRAADPARELIARMYNAAIWAAYGDLAVVWIPLPDPGDDLEEQAFSALAQTARTAARLVGDEGEAVKRAVMDAARRLVNIRRAGEDLRMGSLQCDMFDETGVEEVFSLLSSPKTRARGKAAALKRFLEERGAAAVPDATLFE